MFTGSASRPLEHPSSAGHDGGRPARDDLSIEYLHSLHDHWRCLVTTHFAVLAAELRLALAKVHAAAIFYHNFRATQERAAQLDMVG